MRQAAELIKNAKPTVALQFNTLADRLETVIGYLQSLGEITTTRPREQFALVAQKEGRKIWNITGGKRHLRRILHQAEDLELTEVEISSLLMHCEVHESQPRELRAIDEQIMLFEWQHLAERDPERAGRTIETITSDEHCVSTLKEHLHLITEQKFDAAGIFRLYKHINRYRNPKLSKRMSGIWYPFAYFLIQEEQDHYQPETHPDIHFELSAGRYIATDIQDKGLSRIQRILIGSLPVHFAINPPEKVVVTADADLAREKLAAFADDFGTLYIHWAGFDRL